MAQWTQHEEETQIVEAAQRRNRQLPEATQRVLLSTQQFVDCIWNDTSISLTAYSHLPNLTCTELAESVRGCAKTLKKSCRLNNCSLIRQLVTEGLPAANTVLGSWERMPSVEFPPQRKEKWELESEQVRERQKKNFRCHTVSGPRAGMSWVPSLWNEPP